MMHRISVVSLQTPPNVELQGREATLTTYMTRDVVDSFVAKINRQNRRDGRKDEKSISCLRWAVKPKIKSMLYTHNLWGGTYYNKVLSKAGISEKLFAGGGLKIKSKPSTGATPRYQQKECTLKLIDAKEAQSPTGKTTTCSEHAAKSSELETFEYELEKKQQMKEMQSKNKSVYNRFVGMVNSNLPEPKTLEEKIERKKLLGRCESYKHLREKPKILTNRTKHARKSSEAQQQAYKEIVRESLGILENCRLQHTDNLRMKHSLHAFDGFCKEIDKHLLHHKKQLTRSIVQL